MVQSTINTDDPIALQHLMTETLFAVEQKRDTAEAVAGDEHQPHPQFSFYGKNKGNYLFLTYEKQYPFMSDAALAAFTKTLSALKLTADDVAVLNLGTLSDIAATTEIMTFFNPKVMVFLGSSPEMLGMNIGPVEMVVEYNGIAVFNTCTFDEMLTDSEKKRIFWTTIKTLLA